MDELKPQVIEALKHNLTLSQEVHTQVVQKLPQLSDTQTQRVLELVQQANQNQDQALEEVLKKEPYFYHKIEQIILHTMSEEFDRLTEVERQAAEAQLTQDLANYSA